MPKGKRGRLLIRRQEGDPSNCYSCGRPTRIVVHHNIEYLDLREDVKYHGEDFTKDMQKTLRKEFPKECDERFLCRDCFIVMGNSEDRYDPDTGQCDFTFMYRHDWLRRDWLTTEDAVTQVMKDGFVR